MFEGVFQEVYEQGARLLRAEEGSDEVGYELLIQRFESGDGGADGLPRGLEAADSEWYTIWPNKLGGLWIGGGKLTEESGVRFFENGIP